MTGSHAHVFIGCMCLVLGGAAASCAGEPPSGFVKCRTASDCPSDLQYCRNGAAGVGLFCHDSDATQADASTARSEVQRESKPDAGSPDSFCARVVAELGLEKVEHCNDFQESLNHAPIVGRFFCNYAGDDICPSGQPLLEREGSTNKLFESRLGPEVQKSEIGCAPEKFRRYDIRFEYLGPKLTRVDDSSTFAKLWVVGSTPADDFAQVRLRRDSGGAILEIYEVDKPQPMEKPIVFDASEIPVRLRMRIDLNSGLELYVDDRPEPDVKVELQFAGEILPHIGLEGSKIERWGRYDNFVVSAAD